MTPSIKRPGKTFEILNKRVLLLRARIQKAPPSKGVGLFEKIGVVYIWLGYLKVTWCYFVPFKSFVLCFNKSINAKVTYFHEIK